MSVHRDFLKFKQYFIKRLGRKATTDVQLSKEGEIHFGKRFLGVFMQNEINLIASGMLIANVDNTGQPGSHWVSCVICPKTIYVYDSFGRPSTQLLKTLSRNPMKRNIKIVDSDYSPEQFGKSEICGPLCLAWLACVKKHGVRSALRI